MWPKWMGQSGRSDLLLLRGGGRRSRVVSAIWTGSGSTEWADRGVTWARLCLAVAGRSKATRAAALPGQDKATS